MCKINKWQYLPRDLWFLKWKALGASSPLADFGRLRTSSEDFGRLRQASDFFGNLRIWSCRLQKSQPSQDKNLTLISQKKLAGIDNLFPSLGHFGYQKPEVEWRRLSRFPAQMTLVHAQALRYTIIGKSVAKSLGDLSCLVVRANQSSGRLGTKLIKLLRTSLIRFIIYKHFPGNPVGKY